MAGFVAPLKVQTEATGQFLDGGFFMARMAIRRDPGWLEPGDELGRAKERLDGGRVTGCEIDIDKLRFGRHHLPSTLTCVSSACQRRPSWLGLFGNFHTVAMRRSTRLTVRAENIGIYLSSRPPEDSSPFGDHLGMPSLRLLFARITLHIEAAEIIFASKHHRLENQRWPVTVIVINSDPDGRNKLAVGQNGPRDVDIRHTGSHPSGGGIVSMGSHILRYVP